MFVASSVDQAEARDADQLLVSGPRGAQLHAGGPDGGADALGSTECDGVGAAGVIDECEVQHMHDAVELPTHASAELGCVVDKIAE